MIITSGIRPNEYCVICGEKKLLQVWVNRHDEKSKIEWQELVTLCKGDFLNQKELWGETNLQIDRVYCPRCGILYHPDSLGTL